MILDGLYSSLCCGKNVLELEQLITVKGSTGNWYMFATGATTVTTDGFCGCVVLFLYHVPSRCASWDTVLFLFLFLRRNEKLVSRILFLVLFCGECLVARILTGKQPRYTSNLGIVKASDWILVNMVPELEVRFFVISHNK